MKFEIVEKDTTKPQYLDQKFSPKLYKVSLMLSDDEETLTLHRTYINRGYEVDELDQFYCTTNHNDNKWTIKSLSYLTLRFNDKVYLEKQEKLLFERFFSYLLDSELILKNEIHDLNKRVLLYQSIQQLNEFKLFLRKEKLDKINKETD